MYRYIMEVHTEVSNNLESSEDYLRNHHYLMWPTELNRKVVLQYSTHVFHLRHVILCWSDGFLVWNLIGYKYVILTSKHIDIVDQCYTDVLSPYHDISFKRSTFIRPGENEGSCFIFKRQRIVVLKPPSAELQSSKRAYLIKTNALPFSQRNINALEGLEVWNCFDVHYQLLPTRTLY